MKQLLFIPAIFFLAIGCSQHTTSGTDQSIDNLAAERWYLRTIKKAGGDIAVTDSIAFIKFDQAKGSAGGKGGCNHFGSNFSAEGSTIRFTEIFSTKMFCEATQHIETGFLGSLEKVNNYRIDGHQLKLLLDKEVLLEFEH